MARPAGVLALAVLVLGTGLVAFSRSDPTSDDPRRECRLRTAERPPYPNKVKKPLTLNPESAAGVNIPFGRTRVQASEMFFLNPEEGFLVDRDIPLNLRKRPLRRQEIAGAIMPGEYEVVALVTGATEVTLRACVPASVAQNVHPGTYTGGVVIADRRVETTTVTLTVSLQYRRWLWFTILFGIIVLCAGAGSVWAASRRARTKAVFGSGWHNDLWTWIGANLIGLAVGGIAATSAWVVSYWRNPSWGAKAPEDWFTLLGAMFAAFTAALSATSRAGRDAPADGPDMPRRREMERSSS